MNSASVCDNNTHVPWYQYRATPVTVPLGVGRLRSFRPAPRQIADLLRERLQYDNEVALEVTGNDGIEEWICAGVEREDKDH